MAIKDIREGSQLLAGFSTKGLKR